MIYQNDTFENTENLFADAVKDLQISKFLHKSNVRKSQKTLIIGPTDSEPGKKHS